MDWEDDYDDTFDDEYEDDYYEEEVRRPLRKTNSHRTQRDRNHRDEHRNHREGYGNHREGYGNRRGQREEPHQRQDGYEDEFGDYNMGGQGYQDTGHEEPSSLATPSVTSSQVEEEFTLEEEELFQLGDGLPALPPKMRSPLRQGEESIKAQEFEPETTEPAFSMPPDSDLGAVGKIGVYQMAQHNSASSSNMVFWVYVLTLFATYVLARK